MLTHFSHYKESIGIRLSVPTLMRHVLVLCLTVMTGQASAHITANPNTAPAGRYIEIALRVSHGCDGAATTRLEVQMPAGIVTARPQAKPGWTVSVTKRPLDPPVQLHGKTITATVDKIVWEGGELPDDQYDSFGLLLKLPDTPGAVLWFPVVQQCGTVTHAWTSIPPGVSAWSKESSPAPYVQLTKSTAIP